MQTTPEPGGPVPEGADQEPSVAIRHHGEALARRALWLTRNRTQAADLYQETWERALRSARRRRDTQVTLRWLLTIMHNAFLDERRAEAVRRTVPNSPAVVEQIPWRPPEVDRWRTVNDESLRRCLARLPPIGRRVIEMQLAGSSYREIADRTGIVVETVGTRLFRARRRLRQLLLANGSGDQ